MEKATVYKLKAFHGDLEDDDSVCKKQAITSRLNYKRSTGMKRTKRERQENHVERTTITKISSKTLSHYAYMDMKEQIKSIAKGELNEMTVDNILKKLLIRKCGKRVIRVSSPISRKLGDEVPSPTNNKKHDEGITG